MSKCYPTILSNLGVSNPINMIIESTQTNLVKHVLDENISLNIIKIF